MLVAARDARFYIDLTPRILPEDDDPPELVEIEAALAARRLSSTLPIESGAREADGVHGQPPEVRLAERDGRFDLVRTGRAGGTHVLGGR